MFEGKRILIGVCIPTDYRMDSRIKDILAYWESSANVEIFNAIGDLPVLGRDKIAQYAQYRIPKPTNVLFLDADVLPRRKTIARLLDADKDIMMGVYPMLQNGKLSWSVSRSPTFIPETELPRNPFKITSGGFGVTLVKTHVLERLQWPYWKNVFEPGALTMSEDIYFCEKAREAGFDIWCDPKVTCDHIRITSLLQLIKEHKQ